VDRFPVADESGAWSMTSIPLNEERAVVIIGSGAGGGTLAHELTRRGISVVLLEAGKRQSTETFSQVPGEAFQQLTWLDTRTQSGDWGVARDFPNLPVWHCKTLGGTTVHWTASAPRLQPWELRAKTTYGNVMGSSLIDWPLAYEELEKYYQLAEARLRVTRRNGVPGLPASNNFKVMYAGGHQFPVLRRTWFLYSTGFLRAGMQDGCKMEHPLHGDSKSASHRQARFAA
jgi:choline dehydrogenase-like flavoprotein